MALEIELISKGCQLDSNGGRPGRRCRRSCWKLYFECRALAQCAGDVDRTPVLTDNVEGTEKPHSRLDARSLGIDAWIKELLELLRRNSSSSIRELNTNVGFMDESRQNDRSGSFDRLGSILQQIHEYLV